MVRGRGAGLRANCAEDHRVRRAWQVVILSALDDPAEPDNVAGPRFVLKLCARTIWRLGIWTILANEASRRPSASPFRKVSLRCMAPKARLVVQTVSNDSF